MKMRKLMSPQARPQVVLNTKIKMVYSTNTMSLWGYLSLSQPHLGSRLVISKKNWQFFLLRIYIEPWLGQSLLSQSHTCSLNDDDLHHHHFHLMAPTTKSTDMSKHHESSSRRKRAWYIFFLFFKYYILLTTLFMCRLHLYPPPPSPNIQRQQQSLWSMWWTWRGQWWQQWAICEFFYFISCFIIILTSKKAVMYKICDREARKNEKEPKRCVWHCLGHMWVFFLNFILCFVLF